MTYTQTVLEKAANIAEECQGAHVAFCEARCPMHVDVKGYVGLIGEGKAEEALLRIRENLFLPGTLGRVCAHPCEDECRRNAEFGQPISVAALKRYAADKADDVKLWDLTKKEASGKKAAVIGAGPAGAQAALDLAKEGHGVVIFEKLDSAGGMLRVGIPEYRLPRDIVDFEYKYLEMLGVELKTGIEVGKDIGFDEIVDGYDAVVLANGAHTGFVPPVKGADLNGVEHAVDFLRGVSFEGGSLIQKKVLVVGGGDVAMDCARVALRLGAEVFAACLESEGEMPASSHEITSAKEEGVVFRCGFGVDEILGEDGNVRGARLAECTSVFNEDGAFAPEFGVGTLQIECDTVIFATGQLTEDISGGRLKRGKGGRFAADRDTMATSDPKVFAAGDCAGATIVVEAMALGRKAAASVNRMLAGQKPGEGRDFASEYPFETKLDVPLPDDIHDIPRKQTNTLPPTKRRGNFAECDLGFDDETAAAEAARCIHCECKRCMTECIMMNDFTCYPGELFEEFLSSHTIDPLMVYSCNMCDQCTLVCPEEFKFAELFGAMRKDLVKANNGNSPMPGHKAINMHQKLGFSKVFTVRKRG